MPKQDAKRFWKSTEERDRPELIEAESRDEFPEQPPVDAPVLDRRGFLRAAGFAFAGAASAGCGRAPVEKAIPYLVKPEEITPGRAYHYASTCGACPAGCGLLVKNRDGRPIKLEGNPDHPLSRGGLCAVGQASILGVYDSRRLRSPLENGSQATWQAIDSEVGAALERIASGGGAVRFLSGTINSPTELASIESFLGRFEDGRHVAYDPLSSSAILDAHEQTHGRRALPRYRFERARVIVSFEADFLGTWISPVEHAAGYSAARSLEHGAQRAYHAQFESRLSITGGKADQRVRIAPGGVGPILTALTASLAERAGVEWNAGDLEAAAVSSEFLAELTDRLWNARGQALVVCGVQDVAVQALCNLVNELLGSYGTTLDLEASSNQRHGDDRALEALLGELAAGEVDALFISGVNPVYDLPGGAEIAEQIGGVPLSVSLAERFDETAEACRLVAARPHYLESWGDCEPVDGVVTLRQPCIRAFGETRPLLETLATWAGEPQPAYEILRESWRRRFFPDYPSEQDFEASWSSAIHDGSASESPTPAAEQPEFRIAAVRPVAAAVAAPEGEYDLVLYPKAGLLDGRHAYNAWLQELPDPVTKITWDNYACLSPDAAEELGVTEGDVVRLTADDSDGVDLPVVLQPGQHDQTVAVALGYGAKASERFAGVGPDWLEKRETLGPNGRVGVNAAPLLKLEGGLLRNAARRVRIERNGHHHELAATQTHHTITVPEHLAPRGAERRHAVEECALSDLTHDTHSDETGHGGEHLSMWKQDHNYDGRLWGMAIDLDACTGCSACTIACQVENNVPVVGKDEVRRRREMHWIRIDRYYSGEADELQVAYQPMICQHCENAPCETVCPVLATVHSDEGLNQQVYNRCVGTRYCANNCPYKVRRFNWFDYAHEDKLENLVLNPDVTVRSRGVMEKCSFCVQRIQEGKIEAKRLGVEIADGDIQPACQQSCPADAIVFGDRNDPESRVAGLQQDPRRYGVLEEHNFGPAVSYLKVVRRNGTAEEGETHG